MPAAAGPARGGAIGGGLVDLRQTPRLMVIAAGNAAEPCLQCEARAFSVCSAIENHDLGRLAALTHVEHVEAGRGFITEGDRADDFFNVTGGTAKLYKMLPDGRRQITGFAAVGHFLGLAAQDTYGFSAEAVDRVRVCRFSRPRLRRVLDDFPAMERRLCDIAANELVAAQEHMLLLGRKTAVERVASFLIGRSAHTSLCGAAPRMIHLAMGREDISDYLGLTIETVSRSFTRLARERVIARHEAANIEILSLERLCAFAGDESERSLPTRMVGGAEKRRPQFRQE